MAAGSRGTARSVPVEASILGAAVAAQVFLVGGGVPAALVCGLALGALAAVAGRWADARTLLAIGSLGGLAMLLGARLDVALLGRPAHVHGAPTLSALLSLSTAAMLVVCVAWQALAEDPHCPRSLGARAAVCAGMLAGMWIAGGLVASHGPPMHVAMVLGMALGHVAAGRLVAFLSRTGAVRGAAHEAH